MALRLVIFDWNGTLLSDSTANLEAENKVLSAFGKKPVTIKKYREIFEIPLTKYYLHFGINENKFFENKELIQKTYHDYYEKRVRKCRARAGARELLKLLKSKEIATIILSNHTTENIEWHLKRLKLEEYIGSILANENIMHTGLKDKATRAMEYVKNNGFSGNQIIVVGDSPEETKIARQMGAKSVAVSGGWFSEKRLKNAKPDLLVHNLSELIIKIKKGLV